MKKPPLDLSLWVILWLVGLTFTLAYNHSFIECASRPFGKGDLVHYMQMFDGKVDLHHSFLIWQISSLSQITGLSNAEVFAWTAAFKAWFIIPFLIFIYSCSLTSKPWPGLWSAGLWLFGSWMMWTHLVLGVHAQMEGFMWYLLWGCCHHLKRRGASGIDISSVYYGSLVMALISYPLTGIVFLIHYWFYPWCDKRVLVGATIFACIYVITRTPDLSVFLIGSEVNVNTMIMLAPFAWLWFMKFIWHDHISKDPNMLDIEYGLIFMVGLGLNNHRLAFYAIPYIYAMISRDIWDNRFSKALRILIVIFTIWYTWTSFQFFIEQMWAEIEIEGTTGLSCLKSLVSE